MKAIDNKLPGATFEPIAEFRKLTASLLTPTNELPRSKLRGIEKAMNEASFGELNPEMIKNEKITANREKRNL
ncbi:MAG: hypothetical protein JRK53_24940 [Deltaproteobacteria bacterium]|nr:hypothetical protein [Deltaproteobacteria bacterium]